MRESQLEYLAKSSHEDRIMFVETPTEEKLRARYNFCARILHHSELLDLYGVVVIET